MGSGTSKFSIPKGGNTSHIYTQLTLLHRSNDHRSLSNSRHSPKPAIEGSKREKGGKEETCVDEESSSGEEINDIQSPSFKVYCVPFQFDDGNNEDDRNTEEIKEKQKMDVQIYSKQRSKSRLRKTNVSRKERKSLKSRFSQYIYHGPRDGIAKLKSTFRRLSW